MSFLSRKLDFISSESIHRTHDEEEMATANLVFQTSYSFNLDQDCLWDLVLLSMQLFHNFVPFRIQIRIDLENWLLYLLGIKNDRSITIRNDFFLSSDLVDKRCNVLIEALIEHLFFHLEFTFG